MKQQKGFTLIEMMVVVALIAIIATLAVPSMRTFIQRSQVDEQTRNLANFLQEARSEAVLLRTPQKVVVQSTGVAGGNSSVSANTHTWMPDSDRVNITHNNVSGAGSSTPENFEFSFMGATNLNDYACYELKHPNNAAIVRVLILDKMGTSQIHQDMTACP